MSRQIRCAGSGRAAAFGKLDPCVGDESRDRGGDFPVSQHRSGGDVVGGVAQPWRELEQRDGPGAVLHVAHVEPVVGVGG